ncbi:MAG: threonine ammonia-lyase IlvA [Clostridiales bacterium]|nr:threonine ammonia-lyase IlvA [Clostridiales bacterium]
MGVHVGLSDIIKAEQGLKKVLNNVPLMKDTVLSEKYECNVYLKREDLQIVRSFKIRGAYNKMHSLNEEELARGVVCASAGNHAQGVAFSCKELKAQGRIFMPVTTPKQKINQVKRFGGDYVEIILEGDTFDDSANAAAAYCEKNNMTFIHPFDDEKVIAGQGTVGLEIFNDDVGNIDYVFMAIGGGGLASGISTCIKNLHPDTKVIGCEPEGAASMKAAFEAGHPVTLETVDKFVDGAAVKTVGEKTYQLCREHLDDITVVSEGKVCTTILQMYNDSAIVLEPAGALPISALDFHKDDLKGKNVVCVISGGNNDIARMQEIKERSMVYEGLKRYFIVEFPQRPGALREFLDEVLGPNDDICRFEYTKSNDKEKGPVHIGIELAKADDYSGLLERMDKKGFSYQVITPDTLLFDLFV